MTSCRIERRATSLFRDGHPPARPRPAIEGVNSTDSNPPLGWVVVSPRPLIVCAASDRLLKTLVRPESEGADEALMSKMLNAACPGSRGEENERRVCVSEQTAVALENALRVAELLTREQRREVQTRGVVPDIEAGSGKSEFRVIVESNTTREGARHGDPGATVERIVPPAAAGGPGLVGAGDEPTGSVHEGPSGREGRR